MIITEDYILYINILIVAIYAALIIIGYLKGFIFGRVSILYNILSVFLAWLISPVLASEFPFISSDKMGDNIGIIGKLIDIEPIVNTVFYFVVIFIILRVLYIFISLFAKSVNNVPLFGSLNKIIGAIFGFINATIVVTVLSLILFLPVFKNGNEIRNKTIFKYIEQYSNIAMEYGVEHIDVSKFSKQWDEFDADGVRQQLKEWIDNSINE